MSCNTESQNERKILQALQAARYQPCALCGGLSSYPCIFEPNLEFAKRIGQPKGKQRLVVYALCEDCVDLPDRNERVERKVLQSGQVQ